MFFTKISAAAIFIQVSFYLHFCISSCAQTENSGEHLIDYQWDLYILIGIIGLFSASCMVFSIATVCVRLSIRRKRKKNCEISNRDTAKIQQQAHKERRTAGQKNQKNETRDISTSGKATKKQEGKHKNSDDIAISVTNEEDVPTIGSSAIANIADQRAIGQGDVDNSNDSNDRTILVEKPIELKFKDNRSSPYLKKPAPVAGIDTKLKEAILFKNRPPTSQFFSYTPGGKHRVIPVPYTQQKETKFSKESEPTMKDITHQTGSKSGDYHRILDRWKTRSEGIKNEGYRSDDSNDSDNSDGGQLVDASDMYKEIACICSRWHDIGFKLQFSQRELTDISTIIETDEDRLKKLCLKWTKREGNKATWQRIGTMLRKIGEFRLADSVDERHDIVSKTHL